MRVGVFVNASAAEINETAEYCGLDRIQLHGEEPHSLLAELRRPGYRVFRLRDAQQLAALEQEPDRIVMLDTYDPGLYGGTGRPFDWSWARRLGRERQVILSGGITPENIAEAVSQARPAAVDVSSGVEAAKGIKDPERIAALFQALQHPLSRAKASAS